MVLKELLGVLGFTDWMEMITFSDGQSQELLASGDATCIGGSLSCSVAGDNRASLEETCADYPGFRVRCTVHYPKTSDWWRKKFWHPEHGLRSPVQFVKMRNET